MAADLNALVDRLVDLLPITRQHYYHPDMRGSWSLKSVLPAAAAYLDYAALGEVQSGDAAGDAYLRMVDPCIDAVERERLKHDLLAYCKLDTQALVELVRFLSGDE